MRPRMKSMSTPRYNPVHHTHKSSGVSLVKAPKWAYNSDETQPCAECGWPLAVVTGSPLYAGLSDTGERKVKHHTCPTLSERRELRRAIINA